MNGKKCFLISILWIVIVHMHGGCAFSIHRDEIANLHATWASQHPIRTKHQRKRKGGEKHFLHHFVKLCIKRRSLLNQTKSILFLCQVPFHLKNVLQNYPLWIWSNPSKSGRNVAIWPVHGKMTQLLKRMFFFSASSMKILQSLLPYRLTTKNCVIVRRSMGNGA